MWLKMTKEAHDSSHCRKHLNVRGQSMICHRETLFLSIRLLFHFGRAFFAELHEANSKIRCLSKTTYDGSNSHYRHHALLS